jgi:Caspase domain
MKTLKTFLFVLLALAGYAQDFTSRSSEVAVDFSSKTPPNSSFPFITWMAPENETSFMQKEGKLLLKASIRCKQKIKSAMLLMKEVDKKSQPKQLVLNAEGAGYSVLLDREVFLMDGINELELVVENMDGLKSSTKRTVHVGLTLLADAAKLSRTDYALIFATDRYDNWSPLVNPIFDGRTISDELKKSYGFNVEIVENPTQAQVLNKLAEYASKKYQPLDQVMVFFAGHGMYNETLKEGFVVTRESLPNDPGGSSFLSHTSIRSRLDKNPCEHIFLVMDVCFGGSFDEVAGLRADPDIYTDASQAELIARKLQFKTRKYLTSGGKEYVSDGIAGKHSPFAKRFIESLQTRGGNDGILTISELYSAIEGQKTPPKMGSFGTDKQGSEFVFVVK